MVTTFWQISARSRLLARRQRQEEMAPPILWMLFQRRLHTCSFNIGELVLNQKTRLLNIAITRLELFRHLLGWKHYRICSCCKLEQLQHAND